MTLDEMKLAVCEKLPELIEIWTPTVPHLVYRFVWDDGHDINWPTEGLQVCHEAEKLLRRNEIPKYYSDLSSIIEHQPGVWNECHATYEQRLEALCRVWWPERFNV